MLASNFRIVETPKGYSIYKVFYDASGRIVDCSTKPILDVVADSACGVTDWLEAISLAAEKPPISHAAMQAALGNTSEVVRDDYSTSD
ncbi:MAG: hypothetical protein AAF465_14530 [Pseudomonadota bacterium]